MMVRSADLTARLSAPPRNNLNCLVTQWHTTPLELQSNQWPSRQPADLTGLRGSGALAEDQHQSRPDGIVVLRPRYKPPRRRDTRMPCVRDDLNSRSFFTCRKMEYSLGFWKTDSFPQKSKVKVSHHGWITETLWIGKSKVNRKKKNNKKQIISFITFIAITTLRCD